MVFLWIPASILPGSWKLSFPKLNSVPLIFLPNSETSTWTDIEPTAVHLPQMAFTSEICIAAGCWPSRCWKCHKSPQFPMPFGVSESEMPPLPPYYILVTLMLLKSGFSPPHKRCVSGPTCIWPHLVCDNTNLPDWAANWLISKYRRRGQNREGVIRLITPTCLWVESWPLKPIWAEEVIFAVFGFLKSQFLQYFIH